MSQGQLANPDRIAQEGHKKPGNQRARRTGQLSALLADAQENRAELEARIALGKANKRAAGNKYGF